MHEENKGIPTRRNVKTIKKGRNKYSRFSRIEEEETKIKQGYYKK